MTKKEQLVLDETFISNYFTMYAGKPKRRSDGVYTGKCVHCGEGKSWDTKSRLYYVPKKNLIYCHNCTKSWNPVNWIMDVAGKTYREVKKEAKENMAIPAMLDIKDEEEQKTFFVDTLPKDAINLSDKIQLDHYKNNKYVKMALKLIKARRLDTAINKTTFYISLKDKIHKNRLIIPFTNNENKIVYYQTRRMLDDGSEKYLSKYGGNKEVFGVNKIDISFPYIFIFEGPIDAMFVKNGVAVAGTTMTQYQKDVLNTFFTHKKIWVLDNQNIDPTANEATQRLLEAGETVFEWPKFCKNVKDFNDFAVKVGLDAIPPSFILKKLRTKNDIVV